MLPLPQQCVATAAGKLCELRRSRSAARLLTMRRRPPRPCWGRLQRRREGLATALRFHLHHPMQRQEPALTAALARRAGAAAAVWRVLPRHLLPDAALNTPLWPLLCSGPLSPSSDAGAPLLEEGGDPESPFAHQRGQPLAFEPAGPSAGQPANPPGLTPWSSLGWLDGAAPPAATPSGASRPPSRRPSIPCPPASQAHPPACAASGGQASGEPFADLNPLSPQSV